MTDVPAEPLSRRDRLRADTLREIRQTARRVLVEHGGEGFALRAIAREMGMTAPALYRYFASREDLVEHVVADLYEELVAELEAARDAADPATAPVQLLACARAFRRWAIGHQQEFGLLFGAAGDGVVPDGDKLHADPDSPAHAAAQRFGTVFATLVAQVYLARPFPVPADDEIPPALAEQLRLWMCEFPVELPLGVVRIFLTCWVRLYGLVAMEIFGHLKFALDDAEAFFESEMHGVAEMLGIVDAYATLRRA
ncbi:TetR/AcrR family transcriptional regulator [Blastococcus sp. SYSU D00669]